MRQDRDNDTREAEELRRALGLIGVAAAFAVVTAVAVVGVGSRALDASSPEQPMVRVAHR